MLRAFWPTTAYGVFALRLCVLVLGIFVLWGVIPVVSQQMFGVSLMEGIPGVVRQAAVVVELTITAVVISAMAAACTLGSDE